MERRWSEERLQGKEEESDVSTRGRENREEQEEVTGGETGEQLNGWKEEGDVRRSGGDGGEK